MADWFEDEAHDLTAEQLARLHRVQARIAGERGGRKPPGPWSFYSSTADQRDQSPAGQHVRIGNMMVPVAPSYGHIEDGHIHHVHVITTLPGAPIDAFIADGTAV